MNYRSNRGFTLLEVLAVLSVMVVLAGIVLPSLSSSRRRAFEAKTRAQMSSVALAFNMYKADMGTFPNDLSSGYQSDFAFHVHKDPLVNKTEPLTGLLLKDRWRGPYMELKKSDMNTNGFLIDSWGHPLFYKVLSSPVDGRFFELKSLGPDGVSGNTQTSRDDVDYWGT